MISARNTWTAYDINAQTGQIAWQLGGKHSSFTMAPGTATAWQHDPRELANGSFSIFDNGASPTVHSQSRGIVLSLNPQLQTVTLISQFTRPAPLLAYSQGNMQALGNGDWFMGWGQVPDFSELSPTGQLLLDAHFPVTDQSYRDFRFAWTGAPASPPAFAVVTGSGGTRTVYASWNGATAVASWRVLTGASPAHMRSVAGRSRTGFETAIALPAGAAGPYVSVQALDAGGHVLGRAPRRAPTRLSTLLDLGWGGYPWLEAGVDPGSAGWLPPARPVRAGDRARRALARAVEEEEVGAKRGIPRAGSVWSTASPRG